MPMRMSGLMSGMDTESVIQQLVAARQTKVDIKKKAQTKLSWKQDAWKGLNTKLKNLQSKYLSNMRFTTAYAKKTTKVSNSNAVSVITGDKAVDGVQELEVNKLAKTGYLTGSEIKGKDGSNLTALSKLSDIDPSISEGKFDITDKDGNVKGTVEFTADSTISDVLNQLKSAGLNANFDEKQQRFFVSAKTSGEANDFQLVPSSDDDGNGAKALSALGLVTGGEGSATKVNGQDAEIKLNGASFKSSTNVFEINGLTFTALNETKAGEKVTVTTSQDTDGVYDLVKNFIKEYNSIINEMDKLYNAEPAKGYEPLTDEEKDAMSESEVEKYETKIKDALLRRDENLNSISSAFKEVMSGGVSVDGKTMYLSDFGIEPLSYFVAADNEKNAYHIAGDPDDADTSGNTDKLKNMIASEPDTVISFFTKLSQNLYAKMDDLSKSVEGYRSYGSFYDDKKMKSDYADYTTKIAEMEKKLNDYEDMWYKKFSKMETAMAKMQSNTSALTSMLGG